MMTGSTPHNPANKPVAAILQKQAQNMQHLWDQMLTKLNQLMMTEDQNCMEMGDLLLDMETQFGRPNAIEAAEQCHVGKQVARQRMWVAKRFPKGHALRNTHLTFCHLRVLAKLESGDDVQKWANQAMKEQWSVARLMKEMEATSDEQAQEQGQPCIQCETPLPEEGEIVSFAIGREKRARCCTVGCAAKYFLERAEEKQRAADPVSEELDDAELPASITGVFG